MKKVKVTGFKPTYKGNAIILITADGDIHMTKEQYALAGTFSEVLYTIETGWTDALGNITTFPTPRNVFACLPLVDADATLERKFQLAQQYGVVLS